MNTSRKLISRSTLGALGCALIIVGGNHRQFNSNVDSGQSLVSYSSNRAEAWKGCSGYSTQGQAQSAWESNGRQPASADGDKDGKVCESLPSSTSSSTACIKRSIPVVVSLSRSKYPETVLHTEQAIKRWRQPRILTINRLGATANRQAWKSLVPKSIDTDGNGQVEDRDEYPPAFSKQGGRNANISFVDASDNRGAGSTMGSALHKYCNGQRFVLRFTGRYAHTTRSLVAADHGKRVHVWVSAKRG